MAKPGGPNQYDTIVPLIGANRTSPRLVPLLPLGKDEQRAFDLVVRENAHLVMGDVPMVMGFALAFVRMLKAAKRGDAQEYDWCCPGGARSALCLPVDHRCLSEGGGQYVRRRAVAEAVQTALAELIEDPAA